MTSETVNLTQLHADMRACRLCYDAGHAIVPGAIFRGSPGAQAAVSLGMVVLVLVGLFQMVTAPVAGHLVTRAGYRTGKVAPGSLAVDELTEDLRSAVHREHDDEQ